MRFFKKLIWLVKNQETIEKLIKEGKSKKAKEEKGYALGGVPEFQKDYVTKVLENKQ